MQYAAIKKFHAVFANLRPHKVPLFPLRMDEIKVGSQTIKPSFQGGFNLGQPTVPLPTNDFSQKRAVLDGLGTTVTNPTNAEMNAALKKVDGSTYPAGGTTSGVFMNYVSVGPAAVMAYHTA